MPMPSRKYTPEQEKVLLAFLPGFVVTEPNTRERKLWKASLDVEWLTRWDMKPEHSGMFSTWFRNHCEELLQQQARAASSIQPASIDADAVPAHTTASVEDTHTASPTECDDSSQPGRHDQGRVRVPGLGGVPNVVLETEENTLFITVDLPGIRAREAVVELQGTRLSVYATSVLTDSPYQWSTDLGRTVAAGGLRCGMRLGRMCLLVSLDNESGEGIKAVSEKLAVPVEGIQPSQVASVCAMRRKHFADGSLIYGHDSANRPLLPKTISTQNAIQGRNNPQCHRALLRHGNSQRKLIIILVTHT